MGSPRLEHARRSAGTATLDAGRACDVCVPIGSGGGASWKESDPSWSGTIHAIPAEVTRLVHVAGDTLGSSSRARGLFLCPGCGAAFLWELSYEFLVGGSEDEETWSRLDDATAEDWLGKLRAARPVPGGGAR